MTCGRCETAIKSEVSAIDGVISVSADFRSGTVVVIHEPEVDIDEIREIIGFEGFTVD
jgi:copper chaperone CopZ